MVHADGTARAQLVSGAAQPWLSVLLDAFEERTGLPCLLNTSFNRHREPIVATAEDAVESWLRTGLDDLVVGNFLVTREDRSPS